MNAVARLKNFASRFKFEGILVTLSLAWAIFASYSIQLTPEYSPTGDDWSYLNATLKLYLEGLPDEGRPFGIAAIYGLPILFGGAADIVVSWGLGINIGCWFASIILFYRILSHRIKQLEAFIYSVVMMLCVGNLAIAFRFLPESIFILLLLVAVAFLSRFYLTRNIKYLTGSIATLLFAVMIKPVALGLAGLVAIYHFRSLEKIVKHKSSVAIYGALMLIGLQMVQMKKTYGDYKISYIGNITYYNYLGAKADCYRKNIEFIPGENKRAKYFQSFSSHDQQRLVKEDIAEQLQNNTFNLARAYLYCLYSNSSKGSYIVSQCENKNGSPLFDVFHFFFKALSKLQNIALTILGIALSIYFWIRRKEASGFAEMLGVFVLYIFFVSGMSCFQADRFHLVFFPFAIILIAEYRNKKTSENVLS